MNHFSFWEKESFLKGFDAIVIGSGIVGLNAALELKKLAPKMRVLVLERGILPLGASTKNAGFACFGSVSELIDDLGNGISEDALWELVEMRWKGLQKLRTLLGDDNMDFQNLGGYEIFTAEEAASFATCQESLAHFNRQLFAINQLENCYTVLSEKEVANFGFGKVKNMILNKGEGQIHTGKMMHSLLALARQKGIEILTGINILRLAEQTNGVEIHCEGSFMLFAPKVLVCTNGFARQLLPNLAVNPARNQVWVTEEIENLPFKGTFHYQEGYYYFRNIGNRVLLGGGRHLDKEKETTAEFGESETIQVGLRKVLDEIILPHQSVKIEHKWSGIMGLGNEKRPIICAYSPHICVAVRMGGMGVAIGSLVGEEVAKLALGDA